MCMYMRALQHFMFSAGKRNKLVEGMNNVNITCFYCNIYIYNGFSSFIQSGSFLTLLVTKFRLRNVNDKSQYITGCPRIGILADFQVISPLISTQIFSDFVFPDSLIRKETHDTIPSTNVPHVKSYPVNFILAFGFILFHNFPLN